MFKSCCKVKWENHDQPKSTFATLCPDKATPRSDRAKSQWASPFSHFLKRPLVIISDMHCNLYIVHIIYNVHFYHVRTDITCLSIKYVYLLTRNIKHRVCLPELSFRRPGRATPNPTLVPAAPGHMSDVARRGRWRAWDCLRNPILLVPMKWDFPY